MNKAALYTVKANISQHMNKTHSQNHSHPTVLSPGSPSISFQKNPQLPVSHQVPIITI
ncbi:unnamed protein product [Periconia digitata]|uniref:Uncharacterized protein n=1 Tax=Periconia digitata TaxID=1303443 RepID=A0A9W4XHP3_9PLEO|nr:unnamed protein product [Periconia digitata]